MKFYSNLLCGAVFAAVILPAMANVATTAGANLTAYNGTGAMNNNQWNSLMNGRAGMAQNTAEANFGNCNAIVLRCASPKCASGGCTDMNVAAAIVAGCVNSNQNCKQYGDDLIQYITAQVVAQSTAKVQQQQNAVAIAQAEAQAQAAASAAAAEQNNAQMVAMQQQMAQMQQQMADSMTAMQEQMAATAESQNAQIQNALESRAAESPTYAGAPTAPIETGAVIAGLEGLGVAEQLAAKNGISTDILVREQMGGQIETAIEDATLKMKELKQTLDNIIEYAGCDSGVTSCKGPKRVKKFKDMANEFFDPYEEVLDNMYDALILAMTLGIDVSDTIMLLSDACNIWGKYLCDTCSYTQQNSIDSGEGICACNTTDNSGKGTNCYYRIRTENGKVAKDQPHCRLVGTVGNKEEVWHEWIDANSGITGTTQVACASDAIDNISIFRGRRKKTSVDIDTLRDFINQDAYGTCRTPKNPDDFSVLEDCGAKFCNVDPHNDTTRISQLRSAVSTKKLPTTNWCFKDENALKRFDGGGSSNNDPMEYLTLRATGCSVYTVSYLCNADDYCEWENGACQPATKRKVTNSTCDQWTKSGKKKCEDNGCYWFVSYCTETPPEVPTTSKTKQTTTTANSYIYTNVGCHGLGETDCKAKPDECDWNEYIEECDERKLK
jgi:hypothetical protein